MLFIFLKSLVRTDLEFYPEQSPEEGRRNIDSFVLLSAWFSAKLTCSVRLRSGDLAS